MSARSIKLTRWAENVSDLALGCLAAKGILTLLEERRQKRYSKPASIALDQLTSSNRLYTTGTYTKYVPLRDGQDSKQMGNHLRLRLETPAPHPFQWQCRTLRTSEIHRPQEIICHSHGDAFRRKFTAKVDDYDARVMEASLEVKSSTEEKPERGGV